MTNPTTLHRAVTVPATADVLWSVLTEPSSASTWLGYEVSWELEPGGPARFEGGDDGNRDGRVEQVVPGRLLRFRWWPALGDGVPGRTGKASPRGSDPAGGIGQDTRAEGGVEQGAGAGGAETGGERSAEAGGAEGFGASEVTYDLEPLGDRTRLTVTEERVRSDQRRADPELGRSGAEGSGSLEGPGQGPVARAAVGSLAGAGSVRGSAAVGVLLPAFDAGEVHDIGPAVPGPLATRTALGPLASRVVPGPGPAILVRWDRWDGRLAGMWCTAARTTAVAA